MRQDQIPHALPQGGADDPFWREYFAPYTDIVLIANSDEVDIHALDAQFGPDTLFVFFNKVYKVLDFTFRRPALLVSRSGMLGANIVHRREVPEVIRHFDPSSFLGILNIIIGNDERFSSATEFGVDRVAHLDLDPLLAPFYPQGKVPTTGFGLALWLKQLGLPARVTLAGFSSRRSEKWKVFDLHDWTFEQIVLRLMVRKDELRMIGGGEANSYAAIAAHFPQFSPAEISATADEVLSDRMSHLSTTVDRLMSVTKPLRALDQFVRKLRPKTRKQKHLAQQARENAGKAP
ncbi:hypothetical protein [Paracoccus aminophilus]|uniref:3-deoxy-manno-octulosonate cytidylyltransferase protein n=1 Tax=Paracoccus aminophilus JCM 7686 TaxID=1367847 RepID=S5Y6W7_PARAH|nr:hypothetical protein [Paracoccus aminophilus]AGT11325.1 3-deoxy-manno-octulosonate cytidylyltransferase protein [Paracoccus aminophilus JCM 7686]